MNILAIETSTDACSCALRVAEAGGKKKKTYTRHLVEPRGHSRLLPGLVGELVAEAGIDLRSLDAVAFGQGPGSFTGLRIACAVAQGIGFGAGCPLVAVSSMRTLAAGMHRTKSASHVLVALDARMGEIYYGAFEYWRGTMAPASFEVLLPPEEAELPLEGSWYAVGSGWGKYGDTLQGNLGVFAFVEDDCVEPDRLPEAVDMLDLAQYDFAAGKALEPEAATPVYIRTEVATPSPREVPSD